MPMIKPQSFYQLLPSPPQKRTRHIAGLLPTDYLPFQNNRLHFHKFSKPIPPPDPADNKSSSDETPETQEKKESSF